MKNPALQRKQAGFTILELLIAVTIFSMVLVLITTGVLRFTRQYYKGVIEGKTQDTARAIVDDVTRSIQFNGGDVTPLPPNSSDPTHPGGYCFGLSKRYRVYRDSQITDVSPATGAHQHHHALVSDSPSGCSATSPAQNVLDAADLDSTNSYPNARELLGEHMRLTKLDINGTNKVWSVTVRVVYGDDALLCNSTLPGNCSPSSTTFPSTAPDNLSCRSTSGSQFCAVSELTTTIDKRVK